MAGNIRNNLRCENLMGCSLTDFSSMTINTTTPNHADHLTEKDLQQLWDEVTNGIRDQINQSKSLTDKEEQLNIQWQRQLEQDIRLSFNNAPKQSTDLLEHPEYLGVKVAPETHRDINKDFWNVAFPSLFTKCYGRALMLFKVVPSASQATAGHFVLANLSLAAPIISLMAALCTGAITYHNAKKAGKTSQQAMQEAVKVSAKTFLKFFIVYMSWCSAIALATALGILSGPYLLAGITLVATVTSLGLAFATGLTEIIFNGNNVFNSIKYTIHRAFTEGSVWTLIEHLEIYEKFSSAILGGILDDASVMVGVSFSFVIAGVIGNCFKHLSQHLPWKSKQFLKTPTTDQINRKLLELINNKFVDYQNSLKTLHELTAASNDPRIFEELKRFIKTYYALTKLTAANDEYIDHDIISIRRYNPLSPFSPKTTKTEKTFAKALTDTNTINTPLRALKNRLSNTTAKQAGINQFNQRLNKSANNLSKWGIDTQKLIHQLEVNQSASSPSIAINS